MASSPSPLLRVELQAAGENLNTWGAPKLNLALTDLEFAVAGRTAFALSGSKTLTATNYTADEARSAILDVTSGSGGTVTIPAVSKLYMVRNSSSGAVVVTTGSGDTASIPAGDVNFVVSDGTNVYQQTFAVTTAQTLATPRTIGMTGDVTWTSTAFNGSANVTGTSAIGNNKVTLAMMAQMATASLLGRSTAATGNVEVLSAATATALLSAMVGDSGSGGTKGLVPAPASGDAAANKFLSAAGTWLAAGASITGTGTGWEAQIGSFYIKGGRYTGTSSHPSVTFSNAFPTECFGIFYGPYGLGADTNVTDRSVTHVTTDTFSSSGFDAWFSYEENASDVFVAIAFSRSFNWVAFGK